MIGPKRNAVSVLVSTSKTISHSWSLYVFFSLCMAPIRERVGQGKPPRSEVPLLPRFVLPRRLRAQTWPCRRPCRRSLNSFDRTGFRDVNSIFNSRVVMISFFLPPKNKDKMSDIQPLGSHVLLDAFWEDEIPKLPEKESGTPPRISSVMPIPSSSRASSDSMGRSSKLAAFRLLWVEHSSLATCVHLLPSPPLNKNTSVRPNFIEYRDV